MSGNAGGSDLWSPGAQRSYDSIYGCGRLHPCLSGRPSLKVRLLTGDPDS